MSALDRKGLRTLLVGLDAACQEVIEPLRADGVVPTLDELFGDGPFELESQIPPWTASAWPTIYTGVNPGKHGVYNFLNFDGYDWGIVNATHVHELPIWELLDHHGFSSVVVNVPVTHPPNPFDGALVSGFAGPDDPECHPEGLLESLRSAIGAYTVYKPASTDQLDRDEQLDHYRRLTRFRGKAFRYLAERFDPDFGFVQFQQIDSVSHDYPDDRSAAEAVYEAVDLEVQAMIEQCQPDNVIVASDHGIGPYRGYEFRVNEFLRDHGYVETTTDGAGMPSWTDLLSRERGIRTPDSVSNRALRSLVTTAARFGLTSQRVGRLLDRLGLTDIVLALVPGDVVRAGTEQVDFPASRAYMRSRTELGVVINAAERFPSGVVPADEYERTRAALIELLSNVETPDGSPVFERVAPRESFFDGPYVEDAPDVICIPAGFEHHLVASLSGTTFERIDQLYEHKMQGIFAATGSDIESSVPVDSAQLVDVAPTVLATFGIGRHERMDGRPLPVVSDPGPSPAPPVNEREALQERDERVGQQLAELGYLE